jgi:F-type H+-transporting ATPase subunit b
MEMDNTFWALVGLLIFLGIVIYMKVPGMMAAGLDARADKIRADLDEAKRLRDEAAALLAEYQNKRKQAELDAVEIVKAAQRDAEALAADAKVKTEEFVKRRTAMAEQKIAQAESDAVNAVRASAIDVAIAAAGKILGGKGSAKLNADMFKQSLSDVKARMN